jgi:hypothetical protein
VEAAVVAKYANGESKAGNAVGVLFIYLFVTFYGGCVDVSMYVYRSEIFPTLIRAQEVGFSISGLFISALRQFILFSHTPIPSQCVGKATITDVNPQCSPNSRQQHSTTLGDVEIPRCVVVQEG